MTVTELTDQILALPPAQRAAVAQKLWESLEEAPESISPEVDAQAVAIAVARDEELSRDEKMGRSHDAVMENARQSLPCE